ncbi:Per1-like protein, partial [Piptocephalis cylindrospora]
LLLLIPTAAQASVGDRSFAYRDCVDKCMVQECGPRHEHDLPVILQLLRWSCPENCEYGCTHRDTADRLERGDPVVQYYGKWPFTRLVGMQEPASVLFSLLNGLGHWVHRKQVLAIPTSYYLQPLILGYFIVGLNTWIWSTIFHMRDTSLTEKLDYFSAGLAVLYATYLTLCRLLRLGSRGQRRLAVALIPLYLFHIGYLGLSNSFDYGYNMTANVIVGLIHNLLWLTWSFTNRNRLPYAWIPAVGVVAITMAMSLELLDFPPLAWAIDAHSLWHLATVPLVWLWYRFLLAD